MNICEVSLFENTNLEELEHDVNAYIDSCSGMDIDILDIKFSSVLKPNPIKDEVLHTIMILHTPRK